jgi:hypothetical protein
MTNEMSGPEQRPPEDTIDAILEQAEAAAMESENKAYKRHIDTSVKPRVDQMPCAREGQPTRRRTYDDLSQRPRLSRREYGHGVVVKRTEFIDGQESKRDILKVLSEPQPVKGMLGDCVEVEVLEIDDQDDQSEFSEFGCMALSALAAEPLPDGTYVDVAVERIPDPREATQ